MFASVTSFPEFFGRGRRHWFGAILSVWAASSAGAAGTVLVLAIGGTQVPDSAWSLLFIGSMAIGVWWRCTQHWRAMADTPVSRIGSAAQGYLALRGTARAGEGGTLPSPADGLPVLWYRVAVQERRSERWVTVRHLQSDQPFVIEDGSGQCAVDPADAHVFVSRRDIYHRGHIRYVQLSIIAHESLHVLGHLQTVGRISPRSRSQRIRQLLDAWRADPVAIARFDKNGDGQVDQEEWAQARRQARAQIDAEPIEAAGRAYHVLGPCDHGRPYLIADDLSNLPTRKRWLARGAALVSILCAGAIANAITLH